MFGDAILLLAAQQWSASEAPLVHAAVNLLHPLDRHLVWSLLDNCGGPADRSQASPGAVAIGA